MLVPIAPSIKITDADVLLAKLKIQLSYDGISQAKFLKTLIEHYIDRDQRILSIIQDSLKKSFKRSKKVKDLKLTKKTIKDFNLQEEEIQDIFDIIARENPDL